MSLLKEIIMNFHNVICFFNRGKNFILFLPTLLHHVVLADDFYRVDLVGILYWRTLNNRTKHTLSQLLEYSVFSIANKTALYYTVIALIVCEIIYNFFVGFLSLFWLFLTHRLISKHINVVMILIFSINEVLVFVKFCQLFNLEVSTRCLILLVFKRILIFDLLLLIIIAFLLEALHNFSSGLLSLIQFSLSTSESGIVWVDRITHMKITFFINKVKPISILKEIKPVKLKRELQSDYNCLEYFIVNFLALLFENLIAFSG